MLYSKFILLTPLAATAEPNSEAEYISHNILDITSDIATGPADFYDWPFLLFSDMLFSMINNFNFSLLGKTSMKCK